MSDIYSYELHDGELEIRLADTDETIGRLLPGDHPGNDDEGFQLWVDTPTGPEFLGTWKEEGDAWHVAETRHNLMVLGD